MLQQTYATSFNAPIATDLLVLVSPQALVDKANLYAPTTY